MYKLLVADDEFNIRDGIANTIAWGEIGAEVVATAADGEDALRLVKQLSPDIVITDVSMDNMDGLELTEILRREYPFIKVIIVSGYEDFEFVKRALELKVFTYIIKPVRSKELIKTVCNLITEIEKERKLLEKTHMMEQEVFANKSLLVERFLYDLLNGNIETLAELRLRTDFLSITFGRRYYTCVLISVPEYGAIIRDSGMKKFQGLLLSIREIFCSIMCEYEIWPLIGEKSITLITANNAVNADAFHEDLAKWLEYLMEDVPKLLNMTVTITVGGVYEDIWELSKSFREATLAAEYNAIFGQASIIHINDLPALNGGRYSYPLEKENLLINNLITLNTKKASDMIRDIFDEMERQGYPKNRMRVDILGLLGRISRKAMDMGVDMYQLYNHELLDPFTAIERYQTWDEILNWFRNIFNKTADEIRNQQTTNLKSAIIKANEYIEKNYANPELSLADVSNYLFLNSTYFSRLYKKETGESYVEALTRIRLEKAKKLLCGSNRKIYAISESVGFSDSKYFCTQFKKYVGYTPIEFREM